MGLIYNKILVPPLQGKEVAAKIIYYVEDILMLRSTNLACSAWQCPC